MKPADFESADTATLPVVVAFAAGVQASKGVHVLARIEVPSLLPEPALLVFDGNRGHIAVQLASGAGGNSHVELSAMLLNLAHRAGAH